MSPTQTHLASWARRCCAAASSALSASSPSTLGSTSASMSVSAWQCRTQQMGSAAMSGQQRTAQLSCPGLLMCTCVSM